MPDVVIHYQIPAELHRRAKTLAASQGITLRAFIVAALLAATGDESYTAEHGGASRV